MSGSWWFKFLLIVAATLLSIWVLVPTFIGKSAYERLAEQAAAVDESTGDTLPTAEPVPWYGNLVPRTRINLGLDLQGGIDLTLQVETAEAVVSTIMRDVEPIRDAATQDGLQVVDVHRVRGEPAVAVQTGPNTSQEALTKFIIERYGYYAYAGDREEDGNTYHVYQMSEAAQQAIGKKAVEQALETLRNRVNETGVKEPSIVLKGGDRINVQLPGIDNLEQAMAAIGTTAVLQFMLVDEEFDTSSLEKSLLEAKKQLDPATFNDDRALSDWLVRTRRIPQGDRLVWEYEKQEKGKDKRSMPMVIRDSIMLTGDDINDARVSMNQFNEPYVALEFKPRGGKIFGEVTGDNVGKRFAIVLDDKLRSAPVIRERIAGGRASIEMGSGSYDQTLKEANILSLVLRTGALPAPVTIGSANVVGATLGADTIRGGIIAALISSFLVVVFMLTYYRKPGAIAVLAVGLNALYLLAMMALVDATLTLPGIAGIALTVGMAVDCNIIFYERIREELALGKTARSATEAGFDNAFSAVLDANITTFIAGVVLYSYGSGPIKGFAATLMIGILSTLFTGVFASRVFMEFMTRKAHARLSF